MNKIKLSVAVCFALVCGFLIGKLDFTEDAEPIERREPHVEISLIQLQNIVGDELTVDISGPARVLWAGENMVENDGTFTIPLSQIPNENDLLYTQFPYTGNMKTGKFYPSDSYFARGVAVEYRRFFENKDKAVSAGFIPSKGVQ